MIIEDFAEIAKRSKELLESKIVEAKDVDGKWWCKECLSHRVAGCTSSTCPTPYIGCE